MVAEQITGTIKEAEGRMEREYGKIRSRLNDATDSVREYSQRAGDIAQSTWQDTLEAVRRNPGRSIGIAVTAGVVVGILIAFSRRD